VDYAPGACYKVYIPTPGTLAVMLEELPAEIQTRINIIDEANNWLADQQTTNLEGIGNSLFLKINNI